MLREGVCDYEDFNDVVGILRNPSARGNPVEENKKWRKVAGNSDCYGCYDRGRRSRGMI